MKPAKPPPIPPIVDDRAPWSVVSKAVFWAAIPTSAFAVTPILGHANYGEYGWGVFAFTPFLIGFLSTLFLGPRYGTVRRSAQFAAWLTLAIVGACLLAIRIEGIFCLIMAIPAVAPITWLGVLSGMRVWRWRNDRLLMSFASGAIYLLAITPLPIARHERVVVTERIVNGTPEQVWPLFQNLDSIAPPASPIFWGGFAHPVATRTVGNERQCVLSTGVMAERVVVSEFPSRLRFEILKTPPAMRELNPFGPVHARHLAEGYTGRWGEIQLKSVPGGKTKIIATSAYGLRIEPIEYWSLWSDEIVHGVHHQVFDEIERRLASN